MIANPPQVTPEDLLCLPDDGRSYELLDGELRERAVSTESNYLSGEVHFYVRLFVRSGFPGWAFPHDTPFRCFADDPDRVRKPDAAFIAFSRLTAEQYRRPGFCTVVPDLVAEVISPNDLATNVEAKRDEWLDAGVRTVWIIDPLARTVRVHQADGGYAFLRETGTLAAPDVLPGFSLSVAELFRIPEQSAATP